MHTLSLSLHFKFCIIFWLIFLFFVIKFQESYVKNKTSVHHHHAIMAVHVHHHLVAILNVIVRKDLREKLVRKTWRSASQIHADTAEHVVIHTAHTSEYQPK